LVGELLMGEACVLCWNGFKVRTLHCKQNLDKRFGTQKICWLVDEYILQDVGDVSALLDLHITVFEVKNPTGRVICEWTEDSIQFIQNLNIVTYFSGNQVLYFKSCNIQIQQRTRNPNILQNTVSSALPKL
jgi:hypothetical protein